LLLVEALSAVLGLENPRERAKLVWARFDVG